MAKDLDILVYHNTTPSNTTAAIGVHTLSLMTGFFSRLILSFNYRGLNNNAFTAFSQMIESAFAGEMGNVVSFAKGLAASTIMVSYRYLLRNFAQLVQSLHLKT